MKHSTILRHARKLIASGEERFICYAIMKITPDPQTERNGDEICNRISARLGRETYLLEGWLRRMSDGKPGQFPFYVPSGNTEYRAYRKKLRQTRLNWIDSLIAEYKAEGK